MNENGAFGKKSVTAKNILDIDYHFPRNFHSFLVIFLNRVQARMATKEMYNILLQSIKMSMLIFMEIYLSH